ncbi:MAG: PH domain-containing protein, partial [Acidobacteriota bacterium]|nr:PH domain-containing protein [Acidobacteriota bacterium]
VLLVAALILHFAILAGQGQPPWLPLAVAFLFLWPVQRSIRRLSTKLSITQDKLYYETGLISKTTRIVQIPKIQDVRVSQSIGQRILNIGDLWIETAGESSRLTLHNIDGARALADRIIELEGRAGVPAAPKTTGL